MANRYIHVGSITNAIRGKGLLQKQGIRSYIHRSVDPPQGDGCGYSLLVTEKSGQATEILTRNGVRIIRVSEGI